MLYIYKQILWSIKALDPEPIPEKQHPSYQAARLHCLLSHARIPSYLTWATRQMSPSCSSSTFLPNPWYQGYRMPELSIASVTTRASSCLTHWVKHNWSLRHQLVWIPLLSTGSGKRVMVGILQLIIKTHHLNALLERAKILITTIFHSFLVSHPSCTYN